MTTMDSARWQKVQTLFHEALELPDAERRGFLEAQCQDDPGLVGDVLVLLEEDASGDSLLDRDLAQAANQVFSDALPGAPPLKGFGPYRIIREIGEGGMGVVYLAEREDLGSQVAIKVLRDAELSPARRHRFAIEQRTLAQLNHPGIARHYDANTMPDGVHRRRTAQRVYRALRDSEVAKDIVVVTESDVRQYGDEPSLVICPPLKEGRELYRAS
jgi:serine/threonine-protein kinase